MEHFNYNKTTRYYSKRSGVNYPLAAIIFVCAMTFAHTLKYIINLLISLF